MAGSPSSKRQALAALAAVDPDVVFSAPNLDLLYTREELARVAQGVIGVTIPSSLGVVAKSQWVKYLFLEHLGYARPRGLRTSRARAAKPKFLHQLMDVFVQSSDNLQVWNYLPGSDVKLLDPADKATQLPVSFKECRMVLFFHDLGGRPSSLTFTGRQGISKRQGGASQVPATHRLDALPLGAPTLPARFPEEASGTGIAPFDLSLVGEIGSSLSCSNRAPGIIRRCFTWGDR